MSVICAQHLMTRVPRTNKRAAAAPATPSSTTASTPNPTTPLEHQLPPAKKSKTGGRRAQTQEPTGALAKGRDMTSKLLKKKSEASNLALTLASVPYADALREEMRSYAEKFEPLGCIRLGFVSFCARFLGSSSILIFPVYPINLALRCVAFLWSQVLF